MPLKDLLAAIKAEADGECSRLDAESRAEAEAILAAAREEAGRAREEILRAHIPATEAEANRRAAVARLEASRLIREAREEAFSLLMAEVRSQLAAAREGGGYREAMRALLLEALVALPGAATLRVNPRDEAPAAGLAREVGGDLTVETDGIVTGGVVLEGGGRVVRNTFEERLANAGPRLRPLYSRRLDALVAARAR